MHMPQLLLPAGDREQLDAALLYGGDAVYLGGTSLNLRAGSRGFGPEELLVAVGDAHAKGVQVYFCLNVLPRQVDLPEIESTLERVAESGVDALIIADPGVFALARRTCPHIPVHLSTQANTANAAAARFWADMGATRINLARELSLRDIRALVQAVPDVEFECFVHGAMCLALSGRCLLSAWLNGRSANHGRCTHPCRYEYRGMALAVEERTRPGEIIWEAVEDGPFHSSFWAPHDTSLVRYVKWFSRVGVHALKVEGRMKSGGYVAQVADAYRTALDDIAMRRFRHHDYDFELLNTASRPLSTGFFLPHRRPAQALPHDSLRHPVVARIEEHTEHGGWRVSVRAPWLAKRRTEIILPGLRRPELLPGGFRLENHKGELVDRLHPGMGGVVYCDDADVNEIIIPGVYLRS